MPPRTAAPAEPDPDHWELLGGEQLSEPDFGAAGTLAERKMARLSGNDAVLQNYGAMHNRATQITRAEVEQRMRIMLERSMGDNPFGPFPQPWRGSLAQGLYRVQEYAALRQTRWLVGYANLVDAVEHVRRRTPWRFDPVLPRYQWDRLVRMISYEGDTKYWRDIEAGLHPAQAMLRAKDRMQRLGMTMAQDAEQEALYRALGQDPRIRGWQRMCRPDACPWCCLLSSRGGVYRTYETAAYGWKGLYHLPVDRCTARPVYRRYEHLPQLTVAAEGRVLYTAVLYNEATATSAPGEKMADFMHVAYRDPVFRVERPRPIRTLGRRFTGRFVGR